MEDHKPMKIMIKIDAPAETVEYYKRVENWEGEGGSILPDQQILPDLNLPFNDGDRFEIISGEVVYEDDHIYYKAGIRKI